MPLLPRLQGPRGRGLHERTRREEDGQRHVHHHGVLREARRPRHALRHLRVAEFGKEFGELMATGKVKFSGHGYGTTVASIGATQFPPTYDGFKAP